MLLLKTVVAALCVFPLGAVLAHNNNHAQELLLERAKRACAPVHSSVDFDVCVEDILDTGDVGMATFWVDATKPDEAPHPATLLNNHELRSKARKACAKVETPSDFHLCVADVMETKSLGLADLWPKLPAAQTHKHEALLQQARTSCATVSGTGFDGCLKDVMNTGDLRLATLWSQTEERQQRLRGGNQPRSVALW